MEDIVAWLKNIRPKCSLSGKTLSCLGRLAPPESTEIRQLNFKLFCTCNKHLGSNYYDDKL